MPRYNAEQMQNCQCVLLGSVIHRHKGLKGFYIKPQLGFTKNP